MVQGTGRAWCKSRKLNRKKQFTTHTQTYNRRQTVKRINILEGSRTKTRAALAAVAAATGEAAAAAAAETGEEAAAETGDAAA